MAEIWKARVDGPSGFEKTVAIKRILPNFEEDSEFVSMFISEARLAARLVHPNIVQVHDFGLAKDEDQDVHYIAMEYVAGQNASSLLKRLAEKNVRVPIGIALFICAEAAKALAYAHSETDDRGNPLGFVHRDISPHNLMITYRGDVKVADFGIAKAATAMRQTAAGVFKGKITYMSPEQARTEPLDARSDLFSLGIVLYELATGRRLFFGTIEEVFAQMRSFRPPDDGMMIGVPPSVCEIIRTALAVDREERFQDATEMETALSRVIAAGGWVTARADLAALMGAQFAKEIEMERKDAAPPPDRPKTAVLTNPDLALEDVVSDGGTTTARSKQPGASAAGAGLSHVSDTEPTAPGPMPMPTVSKPLAAPGQGAQTQSALSLKRESVRIVDGAQMPPVEAPNRGNSRLFIGLAAGALLPLLGWLAFTFFPGRASVATPSPTPAPIAVVTPGATATPVQTTAPATPEATPVAIAPTPVRPVATKTAARTPTPGPVPVHTTEPVATATVVARVATPVPAAKNGWVTVTGRPWVEVWIDGKKVADETPLKRHVLREGPHQFRFVNPKASFDKSYAYTVTGEREVEIAVDTRTGKIELR